MVVQRRQTTICGREDMIWKTQGPMLENLSSLNGSSRPGPRCGNATGVTGPGSPADAHEDGSKNFSAGVMMQDEYLHKPELK